MLLMKLLGKAEVEHLDFASPVNQHVGRLEVTMDDAVLVRFGESFGHIRNNLYRAP